MQNVNTRCYQKATLYGMKLAVWWGTPRDPKLYPSIPRIAAQMLGEIGFMWSILNQDFRSLTWWGVALSSFFSVSKIQAPIETVVAATHEASTPGDAAEKMKTIARKVACTACILYIFHLGWGAINAFKSLQNLFINGVNLIGFSFNASVFTAVLASRIIPSITTLWAVTHQPADLADRVSSAENKLNVIAENLMPSLISDTSGTEPPEKELTQTEQVKLYAVQFFNLAVKATCIAIPFTVSPLSGLIGVIVGYCIEDFVDADLNDSQQAPFFGPQTNEQLAPSWRFEPRSMPSLRSQTTSLAGYLNMLTLSLVLSKFGAFGNGYAAGLAIRYYTKNGTLPEKKNDLGPKEIQPLPPTINSVAAADSQSSA